MIEMGFSDREIYHTGCGITGYHQKYTLLE